MSLKNYEKYKKSFDFRSIFTPTLTSELIIKFSEKYLLKNQRILDLGCGGGIISASLHRKKLNQSFYLSGPINAIFYGKMLCHNLIFVNRNIFPI